MRLTTRIRLLKLPRSRSSDVTYPGLRVSVIDKDGERWVTPTLSEALVHLRSTEGARVIISQSHLEWIGPASSTDERRATYETGSVLVIDRIGDQFVVQSVHAGPDDRESDWTTDLSLDPPARVVGRTTCRVVDLELDLPRPFQERTPDPPTRAS